ncbi:hypothetical protein FACS189490_12420 [Clostridia bacterium]|nr:hypothetical protein FACS189490_12420 [Clostridia bacterium]
MVTIINESGLYSLILQSKLSAAKKFKRWVTSEVLPSIRKTGAYGVNGDISAIISAVTVRVTVRVTAEMSQRIPGIIIKTLLIMKKSGVTPIDEKK